MSQFDDTDIGALDCDEIEGEIYLDSNLLLQCATEFEKERKENVSYQMFTINFDNME